jgi:hypothetical protein
MEGSEVIPNTMASLAYGLQQGLLANEEPLFQLDTASRRVKPYEN